ncbi:MAG: amidohydrolase family protein [Planctomycetota bacterium]
MCFASLLYAVLALPATGPGQQGAVHAFVGARLLPISSGPVDDAVLLVKDGRILAVGPRASTPLPEGSIRHDLSGKVLMPGLVCTHSHIGSPAGGDQSAPIQADVRALDAINVRDAGLHKARAGGITTVNIMPGSGHLLSGQTVYLKLRRGVTLDELLIRGEDGSIAGGIKMANGTNSIRKPPFPGTRAKSAALVRAAFIKAREYGEKLRRAAGDPGKAPPRDLGLEALLEALSGKRVVHHHTHRHDDILTVLRLSREFGFRVVLHHVSDAWKVAKEIAAAGAPCSIIVIDSPGGKLEAMHIDMQNGAALEKAGALVGFHTDDPITDSRLFLRSAALAVRAGMSREKALYGMTMAGARMLDLESRIGSLEPGKDADFVVLSGNPLSVYSKIEQTWVEGKKVFDRADPEDRLWAVGGFGASSPQSFHMCCFGEAGR